MVRSGFLMMILEFDERPGLCSVICVMMDSYARTATNKAACISYRHHVVLDNEGKMRFTRILIAA